MKLNLITKILILIIVVLIIGISYIYLQNASIKKKYIEKRDSLYISVQNQSALNDKLKMKDEKLKDFSIFVANLQSEMSISEKKYILLTQKYETEKKYWQSTGSGNTNVVDSLTDSIRISFADDYKKISYQGFTTYFPKTGNYNWGINFVQNPSVYFSELYYDNESKLIKQNLSVDGELINNIETTIDDKLFLLIKNNEPKIEHIPNFWDKMLIGANIELYNENISNYKELPEYNIDLSIWAGYNFDSYTIYIYKNVLNRTFGIGFEPTISLREITHRIFNINN